MSHTVMSGQSSAESTRQVFILTGQRQEVINALKDLIPADQNRCLIVSPDDELYQGLPVIRCQQAAGMLGQEKTIVFIDCFNGVCVDALAAVAGLVVGGGSLVFCVPDKKDWSGYFTGLFAERFTRILDKYQQARSLSVNNPDFANELKPYLSFEKQIKPVIPTDDQLAVIEKSKALAKKAEASAFVVISDRGRGKSSALGMLAAELLPGGSRILITAPSFKSTEQSFLHAQRLLNIKNIARATLQLDNAWLRFVAPDELLEQLPEADLLLVDEAAAIPLPILKQVCQHYPHTVFATTVHGYEGTGRGFFIRFYQLLDSLMHWEKIEMKQPIRWSVDDELEPWLFKLLCLDADIPTIGTVSSSDVVIRHLTARQLSKDESLLRNVFALLVLAHYRTRPSDLKRLLEDEVDILIAEHHGLVIGALLSVREGGFSADLSRQIYKGERRPQGNLLAQTLSYHCGVEQAAMLKVQRIMRIVVHPQCQGQGIGSMLISKLEKRLQQIPVDIVGASFGLTYELFNFWRQNNFIQVRIGFKKEQSSGEHAGVFVNPLTDSGRKVVTQCHERFVSHWPFLKKSILSDIDERLVDSDFSATNCTEYDEQDIESFVSTARSYELCIAGVNRWLENHRDLIKNLPDLQASILDLVTRQTLSWKEVAAELNLAGKKQAQEKFKQAVISCWNQRS